MTDALKRATNDTLHRLRNDTGIELIESTNSTIKVEPGQNNSTAFNRYGQDTRTWAWREFNPYTQQEIIVSRTYTFNGKDTWDVTNEARL